MNSRAKAMPYSLRKPSSRHSALLTVALALVARMIQTCQRKTLVMAKLEKSMGLKISSLRWDYLPSLSQANM